MYVLLFLCLTGFKSEKFVLPSTLDVIDESERILVAQVGVLEEFENRGSKIYEYQKSVGIPQGAPYCAAGQYYCFLKAVFNLRLTKDYIPIVRTGLASAVFFDAKSRGVKAEYKPSRHDLLVWKRQIGINGHIERILEVKRKGWVKTVGFNVSSGGRSGVFYKVRNVYHPMQKMLVLGLVGFRDDF